MKMNPKGFSGRRITNSKSAWKPICFLLAKSHLAPVCHPDHTGAIPTTPELEVHRCADRARSVLSLRRVVVHTNRELFDELVKTLKRASAKACMQTRAGWGICVSILSASSCRQTFPSN